MTTTGSADVSNLLKTIKTTFNITPYLFIVPLAVIGMILAKTKPLIALGTGVVLAAIFAVIFQGDILAGLGRFKLRSYNQLNIIRYYHCY